MRTVAITGANAGLGYQTALALAREGARVVMACRDAEKARAARADLLAAAPGAAVDVLPLDVAEPASIRDFAGRYASEVGRLDVLVHNAGVVGVPFATSGGGHEMHLATNYLGPFALTGLLLPLLDRSASPRIVSVGSLAHRAIRLEPEALDLAPARYSPWRAYARSKLALVGFTIELSRRLARRGSAIVAVAAHPGFAATEIGRHSPILNPRNRLGRWLTGSLEPLVPTPERAARPIVLAATRPGVRGGDSFGPTGFLEIGGPPGKARLNPDALDPDRGARLWRVSERMTGVAYLSDASEDAPGGCATGGHAR